MDRDSVKTVVRTALVVITRLARRTRTQADDLMVAVLRANEDRLTEAVWQLLKNPTQPPSDEQVAAALADVGIRV